MHTSSHLSRPLVSGIVILLAATLLAGCAESERMVELTPHVLGAGTGPRAVLPVAAAEVQGVQLPPEQSSEAFNWVPAGTDDQGRQRFRVRIKRNGSPFLVAIEKFTPLFNVDGKSAATYVSDAYFQAHPERTPGSIQPGDEFTLVVPADTFVVRWQEEREERLGQPARLVEYVSQRGDRLRFYLTDRFPIRSELQSTDKPGKGVVTFHPDLAFLLRTGWTDAIRLAQLVYRVPDPDIFQVEAMRRLASEVQPGVALVREYDRTTSYLDPFREARGQAARTEPVTARDRTHLTRYVFPSTPGTRFVAVEDALGTRTSLADLPSGQVFRIEYQRDGVVRVYYKTGGDDASGKRDPYQLRESARWTELYQTLVPSDDPPVKWGEGEPADLEPFPTARDPYNRATDESAAFDYLVPGRVLVLTFRPTRFYSELKAELEFKELLQDTRERYSDQIQSAIDTVERLQQSSLVAGRSGG